MEPALKRMRVADDDNTEDAYKVLIGSLVSRRAHLAIEAHSTEKQDENTKEDHAGVLMPCTAKQQLLEDDNDCVDEFKAHLEHVLSDEEIRTLESGSSELELETIALGIRKATWISSRKNLPTACSRISSYNINSKLRSHWESVAKKKYGDFRSEHQCHFFSLCNSYSDVFHSRKASLVASKGASEIVDAYLLHALNHVLKTRDLVVKNNRKAKDSNVQDLPRDQGFTRPKVLFLLPLRRIALKLVKQLIHLAPPSQKVTVGNKQRFYGSYGMEEVLSDAWEPESLFSGEESDFFICCVKFSRKSIHLYNETYSSDIIIASPLGLTKGSVVTEDTDFLSSIEIVVIDGADVMLMQNWSHVVSVLGNLNKIPSNQHDGDIMRVREWYLNGQARCFRQTILLSAYADPAMNAFFLRSCFNHSGKTMLKCRYDGVLSSILLQVRQVYERFECSSIVDADDARFEIFVKQIFPKIKESLQGGILLFVPSYFDFVRLRNFLKSENASFCLLGEYMKGSDISRSRTWFFHGQRRIMVYTERAHYYHPRKIRGIRDLIFYSLPKQASFYSELTNMLEAIENPSCTVLFSKFDMPEMERIVGTSRARKMLSTKTSTFMFM